MTIPFVASPNFRVSGRRPITALVIHYTGSISMDGCVSWFKNPVSQVSAHYVIGRDGAIVQMVRDEHIAWHAGRSAMQPNERNWRLSVEPDVNRFSLGIELVGTMDSGFTDRQLATLYELVAQLVSKYHILPERVVGHCHIAPGRKIDPDGVDHQFPWAKCREVAQAAYGAVLREGVRQV